MDKKLKYRQIITNLLSEYLSQPAGQAAKGDEWEEQILIDTQHDHYQVLHVGWENMNRVYYPIIHLDIKRGKIWVQELMTDRDIVGNLEEQGVPKSDIVLAFHAPYKRPHTGYAVA